MVCSRQGCRTALPSQQRQTLPACACAAVSMPTISQARNESRPQRDVATPRAPEAALFFLLREGCRRRAKCLAIGYDAWVAAVVVAIAVAEAEAEAVAVGYFRCRPVCRTGVCCHSVHAAAAGTWLACAAVVPRPYWIFFLWVYRLCKFLCKQVAVRRAGKTASLCRFCGCFAVCALPYRTLWVAQVLQRVGTVRHRTRG